MIKPALYGLTQVIGKYMTEASGTEHVCFLVHKTLDEAETERGDLKRNVSWIRPTSVNVLADSTNRKHRHQYMTGKRTDGNFERIRFVPVRIETEWRVALPASMESYYDTVSIILGALARTRFCFSLKMDLGDQQNRIDIVVSGDGDAGTVPFPDIESDVEADRPTILIPLILTNVPLLMERSDVPALRNVEVEHVMEGHNEDAT